MAGCVAALGAAIVLRGPWRVNGTRPGMLSHVSDIEPRAAAALSVLDRMLGEMLELLRALDTEAVHWEPPLNEANSVAVLVQHTVGATERWLSKAADDPFHTDREQEFRQRLSQAELVGEVEEARANARRWFGMLEGIDQSQIRTARMYGADHDIHPSVAWCVQHALTHAFEHWGQIQLTSQIYASRGLGRSI
jgi:hypothetical protein